MDLRRRTPLLDQLPAIAPRLAWVVVILFSANYLRDIASIFIEQPDLLFTDARLYYQATETWLAGGDPWAVSRNGVAFAGIPPTLLLNLPFIPLGEDAAFIFWPTAGLIGVALALRKLHLPLWWLAWPPFVEGWFPGSPDMALFALAVFGGGAVVALTKPYSTPWLLGTGRWKAILVGVGAAAISAPFLPWGSFLADLPTILATLSAQAKHLSAWGSPVLMVLTGGALVYLGRTGLPLVTPGLWPSSQLHYAGFSVELAAGSPVLALGLAIPLPWVASLSIIAFAIWRRLQTVRDRAKPDPIRGPAGGALPRSG